MWTKCNIIIRDACRHTNKNTEIIPYIGVVFPFTGLLSFLFLDDFEGNANISVAIKSGSTELQLSSARYAQNTIDPHRETKSENFRTKFEQLKHWCLSFEFLSPQGRYKHMWNFFALSFYISPLFLPPSHKLNFWDSTTRAQQGSEATDVLANATSVHVRRQHGIYEWTVRPSDHRLPCRND